MTQRIGPPPGQVGASPATDAAPSRAPSAAMQLAWRRAVEAEQCQAWFRPGQAASSAAAHASGSAGRDQSAPRYERATGPAPRLAAPPVALALAGPAKPGGPGAPRPGHDAPVTPLGIPETFQDDLSASTGALVTCSSVPGGAGGCASAEQPDAPAAPALPRHPAPATPRPPLRLHLEWSEDGVRAWLGVDLQRAGPIELVLPEVTQQLRTRCGAAGVRLRSLVCNGRPAWGEEAATPAADSDLPPSRTDSPSAPSRHTPEIPCR
jgi:hypothetical protein